MLKDLGLVLGDSLLSHAPRGSKVLLSATNFLSFPPPPPPPCRPPWKSAPPAPSPYLTGFFGPWARPTTLAASLAWSATVASMVSHSRWMPLARSTASRTSTGQARPQPSPQLYLGLRVQRHPNLGLTNLCAFLWPQEVCPSVLCVWWCHHARARPGGDSAHRGPGPQFPYRMLQV